MDGEEDAPADDRLRGVPDALPGVKAFGSSLGGQFLPVKFVGRVTVGQRRCACRPAPSRTG